MKDLKVCFKTDRTVKVATIYPTLLQLYKKKPYLCSTFMSFPDDSKLFTGASSMKKVRRYSPYIGFVSITAKRDKMLSTIRKTSKKISLLKDKSAEDGTE